VTGVRERKDFPVRNVGQKWGAGVIGVTASQQLKRIIVLFFSRKNDKSNLLVVFFSFLFIKIAFENGYCSNSKRGEHMLGSRTQFFFRKILAAHSNRTTYYSSVSEFFKCFARILSSGHKSCLPIPRTPVTNR